MGTIQVKKGELLAVIDVPELEQELANAGRGMLPRPKRLALVNEVTPKGRYGSFDEVMVSKA